jgi:hypothetical protein
MQNRLFRKSLIIGIMILFVGAGFLPTISGTKELKTTNDNEFVEYIIFDDFEDYYVGEPPKSERGWTTEGVTSNQYIEARVDPLDSNNMVMLIHGSNADNLWCILKQCDLAPADRYAIHYRIYTPQLSMSNTIYEWYREEDYTLVEVHRNSERMRWGSDGYCGGFYEFTPSIYPSTIKWIEEEGRVILDEFRYWHDNSIDALGGYCNAPVNGVSHWQIAPYRESNQNFYIDDFWITVYSRPPDTPQKPSGQTSGKVGVKYTYTTYTYDPDDDQVYYKWEWGDGTYSSWIGPHDSGEMATAKHSWSEGSYSIRVKAKDDFEYESDWSEPLTVTMPRNRAINTPFLNFLQNHPNLFPMLRHLLRL